MDSVSIDDLLLEKENLINSIKEIEEVCEGIDNENNSKRILELNKKKSELVAEKININNRLADLEVQLNEINEEINKLSSVGIDKILEAIDKQRWFFFKNKPKVIMDKETGFLWPNLDYFEYKKENSGYTCEEVKELIKNLSINGYRNWKIPNKEKVKNLMDDENVSFKKIMGSWGTCGWIKNNGALEIFEFYNNCVHSIYTIAYVLPYSDELVGKDYQNNIGKDNKIYNEKEKQQFTLDIFLDNELQPIFNNEEITELYKRIYFDKPKLVQRLNSLQEKIDNLQRIELLSSTFDYKVILSKYDVKSINKSVIKYYKAIKSIVDDFSDKIDYYEEAKRDIINSYNIMSIKISKKYENDKDLTDEENIILKMRKEFLKKNFNLEMNNVKSKLLSIKKQAEEIEERIDIINEGDNSIKELAILEKEQRVSFEFIIENIANIIKNALLKIEFFERNKEFAINILNLFDEWNDDYKAFKKNKKNDFISLCEEESIENKVYMIWYNEWQNKRLFIEKHLLSLVEYGIKDNLINSVNDEITIIEKIIYILKEYKENIDKFYNEERTNIYQKFVFQVGGDLQEKFEVESELYKATSKLQKDLQDIIFSLHKEEDRIFLLKWASDLFDIQIDEIINFVKDKELDKISSDILIQFSELKRKNYQNFIADAKLYSEEVANRDKQYNSLIFKMRKELMK
ncbi:hypothetical protein [Clostridium baratii]|uniref:hypothetical protein n=1 Tax=Clostridium baratii TaxID=1561 RepID=UPI001CADA5A2|nr:hypothetical protein [Clostridium baratii]STB71352.1 Uncharacterised protein [Clostridium baratii]